MFRWQHTVGRRRGRGGGGGEGEEEGEEGEKGEGGGESSPPTTIQRLHPLLHSSSSRGNLDHDSATCRAVEMSSADVIDSQNFLFSRCSPIASHASTERELETVQRGRGRKRAARVFWCQLAHSLGFLRNQSGSDEWIRSITPVRRWLSTQTCPDSSKTSR